eukprot:2767707-Karenia_brevis.AAC.1
MPRKMLPQSMVSCPGFHIGDKAHHGHWVPHLHGIGTASHHGEHSYAAEASNLVTLCNMQLMW